MNIGGYFIFILNIKVQMDLFYFNHLLLDQETLGFSPSLCVIGDMFKYENRINHYVIYNILHGLFKY